MTAKLCSFARAYHSNFARDKIFDDYLAYDLMGKEEYEEIGQLIEQGFERSAFSEEGSLSGSKVAQMVEGHIAPIALSRIAFAEQKLLSFAEKYGCCQYVICGAGMDTFAFRNVNPNIRVFELDHPDTGRYKLQRIQDLSWNIPENVFHVPIDFSRDDMAEELLNAGFDIKIPTFFAILGVTYYLTLPVFAETVKKIGRISEKGNQIVMDFPDETTFSVEAHPRVRLLYETTASLGEPMRHGYSLREMRGTLGRFGFTVADHKNPAAIQRQYFENRPDGQRAFENIHFILAEKE